MDQLSRIDLSVLYPTFVGKLQALVEACNARGMHYWATSGLRTWEEQEKLYAIGRTTGKLGHIVTKAQAGYSPHNFGIAADLTLDANVDKAGLQPNYDDRLYKVLSEEATKLGLLSGGVWDSSFKDWPHVQIPIKQMGFTWADLRAAYKDGGLARCYELLDDWQAKNGAL